MIMYEPAFYVDAASVAAAAAAPDNIYCMQHQTVAVPEAVLYSIIVWQWMN
jgi:hypothetical protein